MATKIPCRLQCRLPGVYQDLHNVSFENWSLCIFYEKECLRGNKHTHCRKEGFSSIDVIRYLVHRKRPSKKVQQRDKSVKTSQMRVRKMRAIGVCVCGGGILETVYVISVVLRICGCAMLFDKMKF